MKFNLRTKLLTAALVVAVGVIPVASFAAPISFNTPSIFKAGLKTLSLAIQALAPKGSYVAQGQFVCDSVNNPNCGLVSGLHAMFVPEPSIYFATGANVKVNGTAKYEAVRTANAFSGSLAAARGLRTGSSVTIITVMDIVRNETGVSYDCGLKDGRTAGTGSFKTMLFDNKSATGTYIYATPFVKGARDVITCGTLSTPKANSDVRVYEYSMDAQAGH